MIAKLRGLIDSVSLNSLVIDVNGVGYLVSSSGRTLGLLGNIGDPVTLIIDTHVREDMIALFGFVDELERDWFRLLCSVQGVGAKAGLAILTVIDPGQLAVVIASEDKDAIRRADGVGPKLATRIVTELKDKVGDLSLGTSATQTAEASQKSARKSGSKTKLNAKGSGAAPKSLNASNDAVSALVNLGYGRSEAFGAVANAVKALGDAPELSDLIRESLKELSA